MPVKDHPLYPQWKQALEKLISAKDMLESFQPGGPEHAEASARYYDALWAYCDVARQISLKPR